MDIFLHFWFGVKGIMRDLLLLIFGDFHNIYFVINFGLSTKQQKIDDFPDNFFSQFIISHQNKVLGHQFKIFLDYLLWKRVMRRKFSLNKRLVTVLLHLSGNNIVFILELSHVKLNRQHLHFVPCMKSQPSKIK